MPKSGSHACCSTNWNAGAGRVEAPPQEQRRGERRERRQQREVADQRLAVGPIAAPAGEQHQQRAGERQKDDERKQHRVID